MVRVNDEKELAKRYDQVHIDTKSSQVVFQSIEIISSQQKIRRINILNDENIYSQLNFSGFI